MSTLLLRQLLSDSVTLQSYLRGQQPGIEVILRSLFLQERNLAPQRPDHYYINHRNLFFSEIQDLRELLCLTLHVLSDHFLDFRNQRIVVYRDHFSDWQSLLPRFSPLPLISFALYRRFGTPDEHLLEYCQQKIAPNLAQTTLPSPFFPHLEGFIRSEGLRELHIHLNGTTEFDVVWLHTLQNLPDFYSYFQETLNDEIVREQFEQIEPGLTAYTVFNRLRLAARLRWHLVEFLFFGKQVDPSLLYQMSNLEVMPLTANDFTVYAHHPLKQLFPYVMMPDTVWEGLFHIRMYHALERNAPDHIVASYHLYLLLLGFFNTFLVQQVEQNGFDQFQKIANNEGRAAAEQNYCHRFWQISGLSGRDVVFIEGRFAPKKSVDANLSLLEKILQGYAEFQGKEKRNILFSSEEIADRKGVKLRLIAHFIKKKDSSRPGHLRIRHHDLRMTLQQQGIALLATWKQSSQVRYYLTGIDAAANELHAGPEVFAPLYRMFRRAGFTHFTFHVGEDFIHLLSGIRAIYEAVYFLQLKDGNRIGHGTAIGISPDKWLKIIGSCVTISNGEWLDNLIFAYELLQHENEFSGLRADLRNRIEQLTIQIYGVNIPLSVLIAAWKMRSLDPLNACYSFSNRTDSLDPQMAEEWDAIDTAQKENMEAYRLFQSYHQMHHVQRSQKMIKVSTEELFTKNDLKTLQQKVIKVLHEREVVIESMLTSNVRISCYHDYREHHLWRWLGLEGDDEVLPTVCIASDDPGIFATSLRNEFSHLYNTLTQHFQLSHVQAISKIKELTDNARAYCFDS